LNKEADWRIDAGVNTVTAFRAAMADPLFVRVPDGILATKGHAASVRQREPLLARRAAAPIKVDAALSDWGQAEFVKLVSWDDVETGPAWAGKQDLSGLFGLLWSKDYLYVAAKVFDDKPFQCTRADENLWNGDALEMTFSADPQADPARSSYAATDFQFGFGIGNRKKIKPLVWEWKQHGRAVSAVKYAVAPMPGGYVLEAAIPWGQVKGFKASAGLETGFNFALDDADDGDGRDVQMLWAGNYLFYKDPSVWGRVKFL
jgi:hypothetical protein